MKALSISYSGLRKIVFAYIGLPVVVFLMAYCQSVQAVLLGLVAVAAYVCTLRSKQYRHTPQETQLIIPRNALLCVGAVCVLWCFFGGQGGFYYQSEDWLMRNAVYRDLITSGWPVIYEKLDKALVYYISYWLPPALVGKLAMAVGLSREISFTIGNIALWAWTALGVFLVNLLLCTIVKPKKLGGFLAVAVFTILFSGMDIIGVIYKIVLRNQAFPGIHLEWWLDGLQFSSLTTCLFWVFNQATVPWLVTLCLFHEKTPRNYVYLGVCCLACGPIPFLGYLVYLLGTAAVMLVRSMRAKEGKAFWGEVFTAQNLLFLVVIPAYLLYYITNSALSLGVEGEGAVQGITIGFLTLKPITLGALIRYAVFIMVEVGAFLLLVHRDNRKDPLYWLTWLTALIAPFFTIGTAFDFVMRFSIPTVMVTAVLVLKYLFAHGHLLLPNAKPGNIRRRCIALCICLLLGAVTPFTEFVRGYVTILQQGNVMAVYDWVCTLNQNLDGMDKNFVTFNYAEKPFFKYLVSKENLR